MWGLLAILMDNLRYAWREYQTRHAIPSVGYVTPDPRWNRLES